MSATPFFGKPDSDSPPADPVEWEVRRPADDLAEEIEARACMFVVNAGKPYVARRNIPRSERKVSRRVPRNLRVTARTWFEARAAAALIWARKGVHFNPMSIREATVIA